MRSGDGGGVTPSPHGDNTQHIPDKYTGVRRRQRGDVDICGVLPAGTEVGGMPSRRVPGKGEQSREAEGKTSCIVIVS